MSQKIERRVEVKPLPVTRWHGRKDKESFTRDKVHEVPFSADKNAYDTGLTEEEAEQYGKKLGRNLSDNFHPEEPHPYWSTKEARIVLKNQTMFFDLSKAADFVKIKNMKTKSFGAVANSFDEYEKGLWPNATHYISDEEEEVVSSVKGVQAKRVANNYITKMTYEDKVNLIQVISNRSVRGRSIDYVEVEIDRIMEKDPVEFVRVCEMGRIEIGARAAIAEAVHIGFLEKMPTGQIRYAGEEIGFDIIDAVKYFNAPENQRFKATLLEKLNSK